MLISFHFFIKNPKVSLRSSDKLTVQYAKYGKYLYLKEKHHFYSDPRE